MIYPFSDEFNDYDFNRDKQIEYEEFVFSLMSQFPLGDPEELREPFIWADANGKDIIITLIAYLFLSDPSDPNHTQNNK